ncbi:hypothetical protein Tco_0705745 [Tanacetum coccineum]|uniref:Uncharacterized protein n=1 Tax=Tanacetum coccineum TaxID=301880 RepID=A0ABQ4Y5K6_9ASTR
MLSRPIYRGDRVTELHHVYNIWQAKHTWDILLESRNAEMFSLTYKLTHYLMCYPTSFRVFCIVQSLTAEYSPYVFKFMETCEVLTLMELYDVMCKAEYDLPINSHDKTNKCKADDNENDNQISTKKARLTAVLIVVQHQVLKKMYLKLH